MNPTTAAESQEDILEQKAEGNEVSISGWAFSIVRGIGRTVRWAEGEINTVKDSAKKAGEKTGEITKNLVRKYSVHTSVEQKVDAGVEAETIEKLASEIARLLCVDIGRLKANRRLWKHIEAIGILSSSLCEKAQESSKKATGKSADQ